MVPEKNPAGEKHHANGGLRQPVRWCGEDGSRRKAAYPAIFDRVAETCWRTAPSGRSRLAHAAGSLGPALLAGRLRATGKGKTNTLLADADLRIERSIRAVEHGEPMPGHSAGAPMRGRP
ncbi:hypothetical protein [Thauera sinica]|uniref:Uncharacterized protein n=1 Tax=Thauera sinica TaxID=2665146 RepID=A0ABW1ATW2_9RHOO|nr:hypothetical protein [Thauera sp. K11]